MPSTGYIRCQCGKEMNKNSLYKHKRDSHGGNDVRYDMISSENSPTNLFTGAIRDGHSEEQKDVKKTLDQFSHFDTIPRANGAPDNAPESSGESESDEHDDVKTFKIRDNTPYPHPLKSPPQVIVRNFKDTDTINNVKALNKRLVEVINNFNGHIKKIYAEKANQSDVNHLQNQVSHMKVDIEALRRTLTEQSRMVGNVQNVYRHSKKHKSKTAKHINKKINDTIKQKAGNINTETVLKSLKIVVEAMRDSINRIENRLNRLNDRMNLIEARQNATDIKINSVVSVNKQLEKNMLTETSVIKIVERILKSNGIITHNKDIVDIMNDDKTPHDKDPKSVQDAKKEIKDNVDTNSKELKENNFKESMNTLIHSINLKNNKLSNNGINKMKKLIDTHFKMGHVEEISNYMKKLPEKGGKLKGCPPK